MADVSDSDKSPRRDTVLPKTNMKGDGSARRAEIPAMYRLEFSDGPGNVLIAYNPNGDNYLTWSRAWYTVERSKGKKPIGQGRGTGQSQWKRGWPRVKTPNPQGPDRANAVQTINRSRADRLEALPDDQFQKLLNLLASDTNDYDRLVDSNQPAEPKKGSPLFLDGVPSIIRYDDSTDELGSTKPNPEQAARPEQAAAEQQVGRSEQDSGGRPVDSERFNNPNFVSNQQLDMEEGDQTKIFDNVDATIPEKSRYGGTTFESD
ncbi:hypothetical protein NL676_000653 [Syzygium grande]|nr:hypothetical protein NL676_000653 [Syzygium grande]